jgi:hypothetical protein
LNDAFILGKERPQQPVDQKALVPVLVDYLFVKARYARTAYGCLFRLADLQAAAAAFATVDRYTVYTSFLA